MANCLDDRTAENIGFIVSEGIHVGAIFSALFHPSRWEDDFKVFNAFAEIMSDIANCHFESGVFDLVDFCAHEEIDC